MGTGFSKKKKQARQFQEQFNALQSQLQSIEVTGRAGDGLVEITITGDYAVKKVVIKPECVDPDDVDGLQDLIKVALNDARNKLQEQENSSANKIPGMSSVPGLQGLF